MSARSIFLRVFLCLALAMNGVSAASTAMHMSHDMSGEGMQQVAESMNEMAGMSCHESEPHGMVEDEASSGHEDGTTPHDPDCCQDSCQCACVHSVANVIIALPSVPVEYYAQPAVAPVTASYAPPVLPHLIRPPIG